MTENNNAKYAFYYLLSLVSLVFVSISAGLVAFAIIDKTVTDALMIGSYYNHDGQLKFAISALLIAAPIFYLVSRLIARGLKKGDLLITSGVRRWLTYFILFVSSMIILGVFIGVINNFLSGELTSRFILKAATIFIIAGLVFSYYFYDIKRTDVVKPDKVVKIFFFASLVLVLAAFVAAWFFVESPKEARDRRLDQIVINNMSSLESAVNSYYERNSALPVDLAALENEPNLYLDKQSLLDPETKAAIEYKVIDEDSFAFCATFRANSQEFNDYDRPMYIGGKEHEAGYQCLETELWNIKKEIMEKEIMAEPVIR